MAKKILSYLLILAATASAAWGLFGDFILRAWSPASAGRGQTLAAICLDARDNLYCVREADGESLLLGIDDTGRGFLEQTLSPGERAGDSLPTGIYVAENNNLLVSTVEVDRLTERASGLALDAYYENGAHAGRLLQIKCDQPAERAVLGGTRFSSLSEYGDQIAFGLFTVDASGRPVVETYAAGKGEYATAQKTGEFPDEGYTDFLVLSEKAAVATGGGRLTILADGREKQIPLPDGVLPGRLWRRADGGAVFLDRASGDLYLCGASGEIAPYARGETVVHAEGRLQLRRFDLLTVNPALRISGAVRTTAGADFYTGGSSYMDPAGSAGHSGFRLDLFWVAAIAVGTLLAAGLLWELYVDFFKMRVSIMVKQAAVIALGVALMIGLLMQLVFSAKLGDTLDRQYRQRLLAAAQTAEAAIRAGGRDAFWESLREGPSPLARADGPERAPLRFDLLREQDGCYRVELSGSAGAEGALARELPLRDRLQSALAGPGWAGGPREGEVRFVEGHERLGPRLYLFAGLGGGRLLCVSAGTLALEGTAAAFLREIALILGCVGAGMVLVLLLAQWFVVRGLRGLRRGVEAVSAGDYDVSTRVHSGDEVEDLSRSFDAMTGVIKRQMQSLNRINRTARRFLPENLLRLLGAETLEEIDKTAHVKAEMTILLVRFRFPDGMPQAADALFSEINRVIGRISPLVAANGGTVYDFRHDGFHAVFSGPPENAVRCAMQIREAQGALDAARGEGGRVDLREAVVAGEVLLGIIGDDERMSPTAVSDAMNTALEMIALCWDSGLYVVCGEEVAGHAKGYRRRFVGDVPLNGRPVRLYDLYDGDPYALLKHKDACAGIYRQAVEAYYRKDFERARALFMRILRASLEDGVSRNYMYWSDRYCAEGCAEPAYRVFKGRPLETEETKPC